MPRILISREKFGIRNVKTPDFAMKNALINRKAAIKIAKALGDLNNEVVFVGGAMVSIQLPKIFGQQKI